MRYCIDTSAFLDAWFRYYPKDVFGGLWVRIEELVDQGELVACDEVFHEIEKGADDAFEWAKSRRAMFLPLDIAVQDEATAILRRFKKLAAQVANGESTGDAFVIAFANVHNLTLIHSEKSKPTQEKMPDICDALGVRHIRLLEFFREVGWRFAIP